jgi:hypothetical protein
MRVVVVPVDDQARPLAPRGYIPLDRDDVDALLEQGSALAPLQHGETLRFDMVSPQKGGVAAVLLTCCASVSPVGVILDRAAMMTLVDAAEAATEADVAHGRRVTIVPPEGRTEILRRLVEGRKVEIAAPVLRSRGLWGERSDDWPW